MTIADVVPDRSVFAKLEESLNYPLSVGRVIYPEHHDFPEGVSLWNSRNKRTPSALVQVQGVEDIRAVVRFARDHDLPFSVRAGGHEVDGWALQDGVLAIDLNRHNGVFVDRERRRAVVQSGTRLRKLDRETQAHGLGLTAGTVSDTGVGGLTLGGGYGFVQRKFGATIDSLVAVEGISVEGDFVRASADENPELFWGLRGGGGNFLVATSFEFDVHEFGPTVLSGALIYIGDQVEPALKHWGHFINNAPDEVGAMATLQRANHHFPEEFAGQIVLAISLVYTGDVGKGEEVLRPMRSFGKPFADLIKPGPYTKLQGGFEAALPHKYPTHQKCGFVPVGTDEYFETAIDVVANAPQAAPGEEDLIVLPISSMSGAIGRVPDESAAVPRGNGGFYWEAISMNHDVAQDDTWVGYIDNEIERRLRPLGAPRAYLNHYSTSKGQGQELIKWAYGEKKYERLVAIKDTWDPNNVLRFNKNIHPSGWSGS